MRGFATVIGLLALGLLSGCASTSYGTKLDSARVGEIQKGVTTRSQVEQMFGPPMNVGLMGDGRRTMMYSFTESQHHVKGTSFIPVVGGFMGGSEGTVHSQQLQVILTKGDVVEDYVFNDGTNNVDYSSGFGHSSMSSTPAATPAAAK